jgi:TM2 domain-containing membrane protein YozV
MQTESQLPSQKPYPGTAAVLSFIFSGLGQLYNGEIKKGMMIIFLSCAGLVITVLAAAVIAHFLLFNQKAIPELLWGAILFILGVIWEVIIGIYSIVEAHRFAKGI